MSSYYYKVPEQKKEAKVYGFRKAEQKELDVITERLTKPTCGTLLPKRDPNRLHNNIDWGKNSRQKSPSACQRRPMSASILENSKLSRRFTDKEFKKLIRRLTKQTISSRVNQVDYESDYVEAVPLSRPRSSRPKTVEERSKSLDDLCRPTTATSFKSFDKLKYTGGNYNNYDYEYVYTSSVPPEELDVLVDRVSKTTIARANGSIGCGSSLNRVNSELELRKTLPLLSGLPKSRTIEEIVGRLYTPSRHSRSRASSVFGH